MHLKIIFLFYWTMTRMIRLYNSKTVSIFKIKEALLSWLWRTLKWLACYQLQLERPVSSILPLTTKRDIDLQASHSLWSLPLSLLNLAQHLPQTLVSPLRGWWRLCIRRPSLIEALQSSTMKSRWKKVWEAENGFSTIAVGDNQINLLTFFQARNFTERRQL